MKAYQKVMIVFIFGVCLPLMFLSTKLHLQSVKDGVVASVAKAVAEETDTDVEEGIQRQFVKANVDVNKDDDWNNRSLTPSNHIRRYQNKKQSNMTATIPYNTWRRQRQHPHPQVVIVTPKVIAPVNQNLEFVHITKTGGSTVEKAGSKAGFKWGACHFRVQAGFGLACQSPDWVRMHFSARKNMFIPKFHGEYWHTPPTWFQNNPYQGKTTFTIVRNPYDRVVSEFYCEYFGYYRDEGVKRLKTRPVEDRGDFQLRRFRQHVSSAADWLRDGVENVINKVVPITTTLQNEDGPGNRIPRNVKGSKRRKPLPPPNARIFNNWICRSVVRLNPSTGHMLPQHYYVYDMVNGTAHKMVDHILKYESLQQEFANLMIQYELDQIKLSRLEPHLFDPAGKPRFTKAHLEPFTVCLINKRYAQDFEYFGYSMIKQRCKNVFLNDKWSRDEDKKSSNGRAATPITKART